MTDRGKVHATEDEDINGGDLRWLVKSEIGDRFSPNALLYLSHDLLLGVKGNAEVIEIKREFMNE